LQYNYSSELVPEYTEGVLELTNFNEKRKGNITHFYSPTLHLNGLSWRLKVYPNGNGQSKGCFLAVFFCVEGVSKCVSVGIEEANEV